MNERQRHRCHQNQYQYRPIERMERLAPQTNAVERIEQRQCDGCFGYVTTPMEFEGVLLETLLKTKCVADWENELANSIGSVAGDDHTLCLAAYGYGSYPALQNSFARRYEYIEKHYLLPVSNMPVEDRDSRFELWGSYCDNYMRYIKDGQA